MSVTSGTYSVRLEVLRSHHPVRRRGLVRALADSMRSRGWVGRPVLGEMLPGGVVQAWTASHRIPAARRASLRRAPVRFVDRPRIEQAMVRRGIAVPRKGPLLFGLPPEWFDDDRADFLRDAGDIAAATLLQQEVLENERDSRKGGR